MNLFSRFLMQRHQQPQLQTLINCWDEIEQLVITIFKSKQITAQETAHYAQLRETWLQQYPHWAERLDPLWKNTLTAKAPTTQDPFMRILRAEQGADFLHDWEAMQHLAAARESLNKLIAHES